MEDQFQLTQNGQELETADVNLLGQVAALADDRTLAECLRLSPYTGTVTKAVVPYGYAGVVAATLASTVTSSGSANGSIVVNPFRVVLGSRTAEATDPKKCWRDIRSAIYTNDVDATKMSRTIAINANASGNPRWDLVYAIVTPDTNGASATRYVKDPTTAVVASTSIVRTLQTTVTIAVAGGTAGASPAFPSIPADTSTIFYVPLAYVRVVNGFGSGSTLLAGDIFDAAPIAVLGRGVGGTTVRPANQQNAIGGTVLTRTPWSATAGARPLAFIPPTVTGSESILLAIDLTGAVTASWSHVTGSILDNSRDWRKRVFKWTAQVVSSGTAASPFTWNVAGGGGLVPLGTYSNTSVDSAGMGSTMTSGTYVLNFVATGGTNGTVVSVLAAGSSVGITVDGNGALTLVVSATAPQAALMIWLEASAPFANV